MLPSLSHSLRNAKSAPPVSEPWKNPLPLRWPPIRKAAQGTMLQGQPLAATAAIGRPATPQPYGQPLGVMAGMTMGGGAAPSPSPAPMPSSTPPPQPQSPGGYREAPIAGASPRVIGTGADPLTDQAARQRAGGASVMGSINLVPGGIPGLTPPRRIQPALTPRQQQQQQGQSSSAPLAPGAGSDPLYQQREANRTAQQQKPQNLIAGPDANTGAGPGASGPPTDTIANTAARGRQLPGANPNVTSTNETGLVRGPGEIAVRPKTGQVQLLTKPDAIVQNPHADPVKIYPTDARGVAQPIGTPPSQPTKKGVSLSEMMKAGRDAPPQEEPWVNPLPLTPPRPKNRADSGLNMPGQNKTSPPPMIAKPSAQNAPAISDRRIHAPAIHTVPVAAVQNSKLQAANANAAFQKSGKTAYINQALSSATASGLDHQGRYKGGFMPTAAGQKSLRGVHQSQLPNLLDQNYTTLPQQHRDYFDNVANGTPQPAGTMPPNLAPALGQSGLGAPMVSGPTMQQPGSHSWDNTGNNEMGYRGGDPHADYAANLSKRGLAFGADGKIAPIPSNAALREDVGGGGRAVSGPYGSGVSAQPGSPMAQALGNPLDAAGAPGNDFETHTGMGGPANGNGFTQAQQGGIRDAIAKGQEVAARGQSWSPGYGGDMSAYADTSKVFPPAPKPAGYNAPASTDGDLNKLAETQRNDPALAALRAPKPTLSTYNPDAGQPDNFEGPAKDGESAVASTPPAPKPSNEGWGAFGRQALDVVKPVGSAVKSVVNPDPPSYATPGFQYDDGTASQRSSAGAAKGRTLPGKPKGIPISEMLDAVHGRGRFAPKQAPPEVHPAFVKFIPKNGFRTAGR